MFGLESRSEFVHGLADGVHDRLGGLERVEGCNQQVTVLSEERVILDRVAETADLLSKVIGAVVHDVKALSDLTVQFLIVIELDGAWVSVSVLGSPQS